jgi:LacI family transcriptional regulator
VHVHDVVILQRGPRGVKLFPTGGGRGMAQGRVETTRVTTKVIAEICGVSVGSVDRALHGRPGINDQTRERILRTSRELGYTPHLLARGLVTGRSDTVGVILFDLAHQFFSELATSLIAGLRAAGRVAYVALTDKDPAQERAWLETLANLGVDGIVLVPIGRGDDFERLLSGIGVPVVTVANDLDGGIPHVGIDNRCAMAEAVAHIASRGYRRIVYLSPPLSEPPALNRRALEERLAGYEIGLRAAGLGAGAPVISSHPYLDVVADAVRASSERTAVLCSSDMYALKVLTHFRGLGIRVPEDAGLMGFDNIETLRYVVPPLATVDYRIEEIGRRTVERLMAAIEGRPAPSPGPVPHRIIAGETL